MAVHTFDVAAFRLQFPQFADAAKYPDDVLSGYFSMAGCYVNPEDGCIVSGDCLQLALNLMTAHLAAINANAAAGTGGIGGTSNTIGPVTSATIDGVSVTVQAPTTRSAWQSFLASTPYGMQLWALLRAKGAGGWTVGGSREREAFRKAGGRW